MAEGQPALTPEQARERQTEALGVWLDGRGEVSGRAMEIVTGELVALADELAREREARHEAEEDLRVERGDLREAVERVRELQEALERIAENAESWHGDDAAKGRALVVIAGWAREALVGLPERGDNAAVDPRVSPFTGPQG